MEQDIRIDQIHMDRSALRTSVTDESVKSLAESIRTHGLLQAIVVAEREGGGYRLIAGRRRLTACRILEYLTIPARIVQTDYLDEIPALAENLIRLQMNPVEEAEAIRLLHEEKGLSQRQICELTNHGTSWVQDRLFLCTLPDNFKKAVAEKKLSIAAAGQLMLINQADYRDYLLSVAIVNGCTIHQAQSWLLDYQARSKIMNPTGQQPIEPRLPMDTPEPLTQCQYCEERVPAHLTVILRFCNPCNATLNEVRNQLRREPPTPAENQTAIAPVLIPN
jgi:ParB family chromosome partitioning protein